jgi:hypothetical protein
MSMSRTCGPKPKLLPIAAGRHRQESVHDVPELMPVVAEHQRMRRPRQDAELAVRVGQLAGMPEA